MGLGIEREKSEICPAGFAGLGMELEKFKICPTRLAGLGMEKEKFKICPTRLAGLGIEKEKFRICPAGFAGLGMEKEKFRICPTGLAGLGMERLRRRETMSIRCDDIKRKREEMMQELERISCLEKQFPQGELICTKNKDHYKWLVKDKDGISYLPKSQRKLAEALAVKKYYYLKKTELERCLLACEAYLKKMKSKEEKSAQLLAHPEYGKLLSRYFQPLNEELAKWQNVEYPICSKHEENLIIKGTQGKMLRSKSEAIIDMLLYQNKIPFRYEDKLVLDGITLYPDFVIRHPVSGEFFYWEHFGMMDEEEYRSHACNKINLYCRMGILPFVNLIITFETKKQPISVERVELLIQEFFAT